MTQIIKRTAKTIETTGQDIVKVEFDNGIQIIDAITILTVWDGLDRVVLNQDGEKIDGNYVDLDHAQRVSEAFESYID
jgi:hypothetical protein